MFIWHDELGEKLRRWQFYLMVNQGFLSCWCNMMVQDNTMRKLPTYSLAPSLRTLWPARRGFMFPQCFVCMYVCMHVNMYTTCSDSSLYCPYSQDHCVYIHPPFAVPYVCPVLKEIRQIRDYDGVVQGASSAALSTRIHTIQYQETFVRTGSSNSD